MLPTLSDVPAVTLYPDGLANFNGEAARLLPPNAIGVRLLPPTGPEAPQWLLLPTFDGEPATAKLYGQTARHCTLRLRAAILATALFACLPPGQPTLRLQLAPTNTAAFQLLVLG